MAVKVTPGGAIVTDDTPPSPQNVNVLPAPRSPWVAAFVDLSGSVTAGGVSQPLAAVKAERLRIIIQNPATAASQGIVISESLFINFTAEASVAGGSYELPPGVFFDSTVGPVSPELITVTATTKGHKYTAKEQ